MKFPNLRKKLQDRRKLKHDVRDPLISKTRREFRADISVDLRQVGLYVCKGTRVQYLKMALNIAEAKSNHASQ